MISAVPPPKDDDQHLEAVKTIRTMCEDMHDARNSSATCPYDAFCSVLGFGHDCVYSDFIME
jgi:hypothetical protein